MAENVENYLGLAEAAEAVGNHEEAYQYFTKVLEIDPRNSGAWLGKGTAAGWSSNLRTDRLREAIAGMQKAIQVDPGLKSKAASALTDILEGYYALSDSHTREFITVGGTFDEHVERYNSILAAVRKAHEWDPKAREALDLVVAITDSLYAAIRDDPDLMPDENLPGLLAAQKDWAVAEIKKLDPTYKEPEVSGGVGCLTWVIAIVVVLLGGFGLLMFLAKMSAGD